MHPRVNTTYQKFGEKYEMRGPYLEVGAGHAENAILAGSYFQSKLDRFATNLAEMKLVEEPEADKIRFIRCNANNMRDAFADGQFGTVLCNAMIEHDKYFWRSLDEMKRVLAPGGILAIGAPGYVPRKQLKEDINNEKLTKATVTLDVHSAPDYWRFSRMAFKEVICEGLELLELTVVLRIPILVAIARKPLGGLLEPVAQEDRLQNLQDEKEIRLRQRDARLQAREAEEATLDVSALSREEREAREIKAQKRQARLLEREVKLQARAAKTAAEGPLAAPARREASKPVEGKGKYLRERRRNQAAGGNEGSGE